MTRMSAAEYRAMAKKPKRNKYGNRPFTDSDGVRWHSLGEYRRYCELDLMQKTRQISRLARQVRFPLHAITPNGDREKVGTYIADFTYHERYATWPEVEDFSGFINALKRHKIRHFQAEYGIKVRLTGAAKR